MIEACCWASGATNASLKEFSGRSQRVWLIIYKLFLYLLPNKQLLAASHTSSYFISVWFSRPKPPCCAGASDRLWHWFVASAVYLFWTSSNRHSDRQHVQNASSARTLVVHIVMYSPWLPCMLLIRVMSESGLMNYKKTQELLQPCMLFNSLFNLSSYDLKWPLIMLSILQYMKS